MTKTKLTDEILLIEIDRDAIEEFHITVTPKPATDMDGLCTYLFGYLLKEEINIVQSFVFGRADLYDRFIDCANNRQFPLTWLECSEHDGHDFDGMFLYGVRGVDVNEIKADQNIVGCTYADDDAIHLFLGGIRSDSKQLKEFEQADEVIHTIEKYLQSAGMEMTDIARTWFYNDNILAWYNEFNKIRTDFYSDKGVFENMIPASTGIEARSIDNSALTAAVLALKPKHQNVVIKEVDSPLQCSATSYGSSFSRAVEVKTADYHKLIVSGTASIDLAGNTVYQDDIAKQIEQTMNTVKEILNQCEMAFEHVVRSFVYLKETNYIGAFREYLTETKCADFPMIVTTHTTICRDDLLLEIEVDAMKLM